MIRIVAALLLLTAGLAHAQPPTVTTPPPPEPKPLPQILEMEGSYTIGHRGILRPGLGIPPDMLGQMMSNFYPYTSWQNREEGETTLLMCVSAAGKVVKTALYKSSGFPRLDSATEALMATVPMRPALLLGQPVLYCNYTITVVWVMPDDMPPPDDEAP